MCVIEYTSEPEKNLINNDIIIIKHLLKISVILIILPLSKGCPRGEMVKAMDSGIVVSEFVLQSCYYVHFRANTLGKGMNSPYPTSNGLNSTTTVLLGEWLWHWITYRGWYDIKQRIQIHLSKNTWEYKDENGTEPETEGKFF